MEKQILSGLDNFQILDLLLKYKRNWIWFVFSVFFCCGVAVLVIWTTPKTYSRSASVMIKDDSSIPELTTTVFTDGRRTVMARNSNVKNEIIAIQSPQLIEEVVTRLNLTVKYSHLIKMKTKHLYTRIPITATFPDSDESDAFSFRVEFDHDDSFVLSNFKLLIDDKTKKFNQSIRGHVNDTIQTPIGKVSIAPTNIFGDDWLFAPIDVLKVSTHAETMSYVKSLKANLASRDNAIIKLELTDRIIQRAEDFLNALIELYDEKWLEDNNKSAVRASEFYEEQLQIVKKEVEALDDQLQQYKSQNLLTDVRSAASLYTAQSNIFSNKINEINSQLATAKFIKRQLEDDNTTVLSGTGLNNPAIEAQMNNYNETWMERAKLLINSSENNYTVSTQTEKLKKIKVTITQSVDNHIEALTVLLKSYQSQEAQMNRQIASNPAQEMKLLSIEREHQTKVNQYVGLMQKKLDNDMALVVSATNTRLIVAPSGTNIPVKPKSKMLMMAAFVIGMMIPAGIIWGKENIDTTIREKKDLDNLSVPLLGIISHVNKTDKNEKYLFIQENANDPLNESFRMVRTNLYHICDKNQKVVMFTSLEPGSGKTFTALNLAMTLALADKKVALLDVDFRTAALSMSISMPEMGIVDFLNGRTSDENYVIKKDFYYPGFDVIPVGIIPPNPTEMLMRDRFKILIEKLKTRYDYIFLDSTPLDVVADATIIAKYVDISVFVVREGYTDRRKIQVLEETYKRGHFKNMMLILNGSKQEIYLNKHHSYYSDKIKNVALLPRESYTRANVKQLTEGSKKTTSE